MPRFKLLGSSLPLMLVMLSLRKRFSTTVSTGLQLLVFTAFFILLPGAASGQETKEFDLSSLPEEWQWGFVEEPIWQSQSFIVQAGTQHEQSVLLVHGIDGGFTDWLNVIKNLSGRYHIIAVDLPGFGRSQDPLTPLSPDNYSKFLGWVAAEYAKSPMIVIGHSMGAAVSLQFTADNSGLVERLVLVDAAGILERTALMKESVNLPAVPKGTPEPISNFARKVNQFAKSIVEWTSTTPDPTPMISASDGAWQFLFEGSANANAGLALIMHDFSDVLDKVEQPTWLIWGQKDAVAPVRTGRLLVGRLANAELNIIEGAAHVPMKTHPREFQRLLEMALTTQPDLRKRFSKKQAFEKTNSKILYCANQNGQRYSGHYKAIFIENCQGVSLVNVTAEQMIINRSQVTMTNVAVRNSGGAAIKAELSIIAMTNAELDGLRGIESDGSRWDLAGITIKAVDEGVMVARPSRFVVSVSKLITPAINASLHGVYAGEHRQLDYLF